MIWVHLIYGSSDSWKIMDKQSTKCWMHFILHSELTDLSEINKYIREREMPKWREKTCRLLKVHSSILIYREQTDYGRKRENKSEIWISFVNSQMYYSLGFQITCHSPPITWISILWPPQRKITIWVDNCIPDAPKCFTYKNKKNEFQNSNISQVHLSMHTPIDTNKYN